MKRKIKLRFLVQTIFFVLVMLTAINHNAEANGVTIPLIGEASVHVVCPFGAIVSFYKLITTGSLVNKIHESAMVIFSATFILAILFGPVFCGWVCPLGSFQEFVSQLGKKLGLHNRWSLPKAVDSVFRQGRYLVLIWALYVTARSGQLIFADYDPYYALFNFWSGEVALSALVILGITIFASFAVNRPWCKYACPLGALLGLSNKFRLFGIHRSASTCINCSNCNSACPMDIDVENLNSVKHTQCISCYECTSELNCPIEDTVQIKIGGILNEN